MRFALFVMPLLLLAACAPQSPPNTVKIGGAFGLTGDAQTWGSDEQRGVLLAIEEANAQGSIQFHLIAEDTHSTQAGSLSAIQKLMTVDKVSAIVGPTWGDSFGSIVAPVGEENKVVQITPSGALDVAEKESEYPFYFSTFFPIQSEIATHMTFIAAKRYTRLVYVYDEDPFDTTFSTLYEQTAQKNGFTNAGVFNVPVGTQDFKTIILKIKENHPDVVVLEIMNVAQMGLFAKQARELGLSVPVLSSAGAQTNDLLDTYAQYVNGTFFFSSPQLDSGQYVAFEARFAKRYGEKPFSPIAGTAYDATRLIVAAVDAGARSGEDIRTYVATNNLSGTSVKTLAFTEKGSIADAPFVMKTVKDGKFVVVEN